MPGFGALLTGHTLVGRYRIGGVIGHGGFAAVYEAHDERLGRGVAVKVITLGGPDGSLEQEIQRRFLREARASAGLQHHNVVGIFDFGTDPDLGLDFLVMERLRGEDLRTRLRRPDPIPLPEAMHILNSAAAGIAAGHQAGIIHRDVKPANIFLTESREAQYYRVCLLDFGIALLVATDATTTRLTRHGMPLSVAYASPEQLKGSVELTPASDVFGLGVVAYEVLGRRRLFSGSALHALEERLAAPPPLRELNPEVPPHVAAAVQKALNPDPVERFPDAQAFAQALGAPAGIVVAAPVVGQREAAEPPRAPGHPVRRPWWSAPVAVVAALLVIAAVARAVLLSYNGSENDHALASRSAEQPTHPEPAPPAVATTDQPTGKSPTSGSPDRASDSVVAQEQLPESGQAEPGRVVAPSPKSPPPASSAPKSRPSRPTPAAPRGEPSSTTPRTVPAPTSEAAAAAGGPEFRENLPHRCQSHPSAAEASACLQRDLAAADRELNAVYQRVLSRLDADKRQALRESQRAWLRRYDRVITSYYSTRWGNHSRIRVLPSQIQALRDRTAYLREVEGGGQIR